MTIKGLTVEEVKKRKESGRANNVTVKPVTFGSIAKKHTVTLFNIVCFALAVVCLFCGEPKNAIFIFIPVVNTIIAIVNDVRAKRLIDKLQLIAEKHATVIRGGKKTEIDNSEIVEDDIIIFRGGDQIIVDCTLLDGGIEVNESFITGESRTIKKSVNDKLISGSFVIAGSCYAKVTAVGEACNTNKILKSAKSIKEDTSELFSIMQNIIKYVSFALLPIGVFLFFNQLEQSGGNVTTAILSTVSALISMIPEGLLLLTSSVLALASIRLSRQKVLISDLYSIETLAKVDTICLDKTGTITTGSLSVEKVIPLAGHEISDVSSAVSIIIGHLSDNNATYFALEKKFGKDSSREATSITPFSSERKFSGVKIGDVEYLMGAYEFVTSDRTYLSDEAEYAKTHRVITVLKRENNTDTILGFILLSDEIRKNAKSLIKYFYENDVNVRVISGDNLGTIENICASVGLKSPKSVDVSQSSKKWDELVREYNIFARVRPDEKQALIRALEDAGHTVAMTGDGVNDVLALREASCGISVGAGADAAKRVSDFVLLDDDFSKVPEIIKEGRRTSNNVTRSSTLFLSKTIYASVLSICYIFLPFVYPFSPVEMAFVNFIITGAPSFLLALEPNFARKKISFFKNAMKYCVPSALSVICSVITFSIISSSLNLSSVEGYTFSAFIVMFVGFLLMIRISRPLNTYKKIVCFGLMILTVVAYLIPVVRDFYNLSILSFGNYFILVMLLAATTAIFYGSAVIINKLVKS